MKSDDIMMKPLTDLMWTAEEEDDVDKIKSIYPETEFVMIGRGYLRFPGFAGNDTLKGDYNDKQRLIDFAEELERRYAEVLYGDRPLLFKMKELWTHMKDSFEEGDKLFKKIKKSKTIDEYNDVISLAGYQSKG